MKLQLELLALTVAFPENIKEFVLFVLSNQIQIENNGILSIKEVVSY